MSQMSVFATTHQQNFNCILYPVVLYCIMYIFVHYRLYGPQSYKLNLAGICYIYKQYEYNSLYFRCLKELGALPEDGVVAPKHVGVSVNRVIVYIVCAFSWSVSQNKSRQGIYFAMAELFELNCTNKTK